MGGLAPSPGRSGADALQVAPSIRGSGRPKGPPYDWDACCRRTDLQVCQIAERVASLMTFRRLLPCAFALAVALAWRSAQPSAQDAPSWIEPGQQGVLASRIDCATPTGSVGVINSSGPVSMAGHPFFAPIGTNGRA